MAEPTSSLSVLQLATRIAKEAGTAYRGVSGDSRAMPPVNHDDLEDIKQVVNDGVRQFMSDAPPPGWEWRKRIIQVPVSNVEITGTADAADSTSLTDATLETTYATNDLLNTYWCYITGGTGDGSYAQITDYTASGGVVTVADWLDQYGNAGGTDPAADSTFTITQYETVAGDVGRLPLPEYYGGEISGDINYDKDSVHRQRIFSTAENIIRKRRQNSKDTGYPFMAAVRQLEPASSVSGPKRRQELLIYPDPIQVDILEWPYVLGFNEIDFEIGVGDSASTTTIVDATRDEVDDYFNGWRIDIIDGTGRGSYAIVTDYTGSTGTFTVADWLKADGTAGGTDPAADSVYYVEPLNNLIPSPPKFDEVVKASCLSEAEQFFSNIQAGHIERYIQKALPRAYETDARARMFTKVGRGRPYNRTWQTVTKV
jgi:hypothetical protein